MAEDETYTARDVTVKVETEKAILCVIDGDEHWIAKSQIDEDSEVYAKNTEGKLVITMWLAERLGLA
jgi:hypothetical protein